MKPIVSVILVNRDGGPFDAAWRAIEAQDLSADQLDVHVLSPVGGAALPVPTPDAATVVFLGAPVLPAPDLARLAHERLNEIDDASSTILQGRALPYDDVTDPVSRRVIEGQWSDYARITDPDDLPFHRLDPRCLVLTADHFVAIGHVLLETAFDRHRAHTALGHTLTSSFGVTLRVRPRLRVYQVTPVSIDEALERVHIESIARFELAARAPKLERAFGIPPRAELLSGDPSEQHRRTERLTAIARELAKLDLPHVLGSEPPDLPASEHLERLTDDVLRLASDSMARTTWITAAHERAAAEPHGPAVAPAAFDAPERAPEDDPRPSLSETPVPKAATSQQPDDVPSLRLTPGDELAAGGPPPSGPALSVVIVATDAAETLRECLAAIDAHTEPDYEIIIVDNGSIDSTGALARRDPHVQMVLPLTEPVGYAEAANLGLRVARGQHVVLLEPDAVPGPGWAKALLDAACDGVGAVGPVSNGLLGEQSLVRWLDRFNVLDDVRLLVESLTEQAVRNGTTTHVTKSLSPLCVLLPRHVLTEIGPCHAQLWTAEATLLEIALRLSRAERTMLVATDAFVARAGGSGRLLSAPDASAAAPGRSTAERRRLVETDLAVLRGLARTRANVPAARELWGVDLPGFGDSDESARLSIVIPVCNQLDFTKACLDSIRKGSLNDVEIIVVDNGSTDGTADHLSARGDVTFIRNEQNLGFSPAVNQGLRRANGREILVLNNDVILPHRMLERLARVLEENPAFDVLGPVTNAAAPSQQITASYDDLEDLDAFADSRWATHGTTLREEPVVLGFAMLMRRIVLDSVGGFDERFEVGNFEDNDFSLRATVAGHRLGVADGVFIHHFGGRTFIGEGFDYAALMHANHARFVDKWRKAPAGAAPTGPAPAAPPGAPVPRERPATEPAAPASAFISRADEDPSITEPDKPATPGWLPLDATPAPEPAHAGPQAPESTHEGGESTGRWAERDRADTGAASVVEGAPAGEGSPADAAERLAPGDIYLVANDRLENGRFEEAEQLFAWAIDRMPDLVLAHMGRGLALARLGRLEEAATELEHTVRLEPSLSEAFNNLGVVYYMMGRLDHAMHALRRGVELDPDNAEARANLEEIKVRAGAGSASASATS